MDNNFSNYVWPWIGIQSIARPDRSIPEDQKDENYHAQCARYYLSQQYTPYVNWYRTLYMLNLRYAIDSDDAWGEEDDIRMFLGDEENPTGRVALKFPLIRPMLTRLTGAVDNISVSAVASTATPHFAKTREEEKLGLALLYSQAAQAGPMMQGAYKERGISADEEEVRDAHENFYQDELIEAISNMLSIMALKSQFDKKKRKCAENLALSGMVISHCAIHGLDLVWELVDPADAGWDSSAIKPDMTDGEYAYLCPQMDVGAIAERWQPKAEYIKTLDSWSSKALINGGNQQMGWPQRRPRVITVYWKDMKYAKRGFVLKDGEPHYCSIDEPDITSGDIKYTNKDLITPPQNEWYATWTEEEKRQNFQRRYVEVVRYCSFIPWEYFPGAFTGGNPYDKRGNSKAAKETGITNDMVFDYGIYPLQESDPDHTYSVSLPLKFSAWSYLSGYVISPITAALSPQRVMNQVTSDLIWRMNKAGNKSVVFDSTALAGSTMTEEEILTALKNGDPVNIKASINGGVQNSIDTADTSPGAEFYNQFTLIKELSNISQSSTGVYDQNYGAPSGDQLVGVKQLQLQQAGVMQQPFYAAIADLYEQMHQFNAQAGKDYYARIPFVLKQMVGDNGADAIKLAEDMTLEQFRVKVDLAPDGEITRKYIDTEMIPGYMQLGLLDPATAASLLGRSSMAEVNKAARGYTKKAQMAAQKQSQDMAKQQQLAGLAQQDQNLALQQKEMYDKMVDVAAGADQMNQKAAAPVVTAAAKMQHETP